MLQPPRPMTYSFLNWSEMTLSIIQGIFISAGILFIYQYAVYNGGNEDLTRTMVFVTLVSSNIFLTLVNRSFYFSFIDSLKNKNILIWAVIGVTLALLLAIIYIPVIRDFFHLTVPSLNDIGMCLVVAGISVFWFELYKWFKRRTRPGFADARMNV